MTMELMRRPDVDPRDEQIAELTEANRELTASLREANAELARVRRESTVALAALRKQLTPLYRALQGVFGELDAAGVADAPSGQPSGAWEEWKRRLGPSCAQVIETLLLGGEMTVTAIAVSAKMGKNTVYAATSKLGQAGLLVKNGGKFSLKQIG